MTVTRPSFFISPYSQVFHTCVELFAPSFPLASRKESAHQWYSNTALPARCFAASPTRRGRQKESGSRYFQDSQETRSTVHPSCSTPFLIKTCTHECFLIESKQRCIFSALINSLLFLLHSSYTNLCSFCCQKKDITTRDAPPVLQKKHLSNESLAVCLKRLDRPLDQGFSFSTGTYKAAG